MYSHCAPCWSMSPCKQWHISSQEGGCQFWEWHRLAECFFGCLSIDICMAEWQLQHKEEHLLGVVCVHTEGKCILWQFSWFIEVADLERYWCSSHTYTQSLLGWKLWCWQDSDENNLYVSRTYLKVKQKAHSVVRRESKYLPRAFLDAYFPLGINKWV